MAHFVTPASSRRLFPSVAQALLFTLICEGPVPLVCGAPKSPTLPPAKLPPL